ncbi:acyl-CoA dehydrogenase family protein [Novosphingobium panipatense]|uniref:Acyl-CoA dehydrogenase n=1 Tax=Novosphingobium panipatense TaxID=428991 RepID=A0ABY1Q5P5_9SPHN|nr:acyl-CoA dehydrogenase family protein [Novosphingobium panipatense]SMP60651.1 Acyl-CoA dehydrogenase [Novosphingobium panipatense]
MEFAFTDEQRMVADTARDFFVENATSERTRKAMAADGIDRALWNDFCNELGLAGVSIPEELGGAGLGLVELAIIAEAAGSQVAALPQLGSLVLCAKAIAAGGTAEQQQDILPGLLTGETIAAYVHDPVFAGSDGAISGTAQFVLHGASAQTFVVTSNSEGWVVAADAPGVTVMPLTTMDQTRPYARVTLDAVRGTPLADAGKAMQAAHQAGFVAVAAEALGLAQEALDRTVAYSKERVQFGRPIGSFQAYKHRVADMMVDIEQARSAVYWAACAIDEGAEEAALAAHSAKSFAADTAFRCAADMMQLHGGIGFTWEHDCHLFFKRARALQSMLGDGNWHREQIAKMVLGETA